MTVQLEVPAFIGKKRDGGEYDADELQRFFDAYLAGDVAEEQMSAFLMAGVLRGFSVDEAVAMTDILARSGEMVDLSGLRGPVVDKHSTGGVGDTCTLVVAPLLVACGAQVAKLSGRGLGHTGGTLDKLESIPGVVVALEPDRFHAQVEDIGIAVAAATADIVPLDKRLYALRDVTATVPSVALIAASVMSKKLAGGADHIILDVKAGSGAFMATEDDAADLAELCVRIGRAHGRTTGALVSDMNQPLSHAVGNAIEVRHAIEVLTGIRGGRFRDLCLELASGGLQLTGVASDDADTQVRTALDNGSAAACLEALVVAQGGDAKVMDAPGELLPAAPVRVEVTAPAAGCVRSMACADIGLLAGALGAGRQHKDDTIDPAVGLEMAVEVGDAVSEGDLLATLHLRDAADAEWASPRLVEAIEVGEDVAPLPLVRRRVRVGES